MNEQLKTRIILTGDIQRDIISSLSMAGAWPSQWLHCRIRGWSLHVPGNSHTVSAVTVNHRAGWVGRDLNPRNSGKEHTCKSKRRAQESFTFPIERTQNPQTAVMPDTGACLQQHKVKSHVNQAGTQPMLWVLGLALCTWPGLSISHGSGWQPPEMSCSPSRAVRAILSPVTWIKTEDQGLNEKQISVVSVLAPQLQEFKAYLPSWQPGLGCPWQPCSCRYSWTQRCSVQLSLHPSSLGIHRINEPPSKAQS